ncbi:MAG: lytic murein transglycosylase [Gordonia sp. (in: high G+C Gram-positive bacteria)]|uniref:lytic transglycosylase domain-containing protein n=1 Tax=Gordonia sp. (in: high G+C Gram-positive bacteria) TaxID=84139 RepID=UPI003BB5B91A
MLGCVALVATGCSLPFGQSDIPEDTPPLPGITQPAIDIHAPGRTADRMREWAEPIANETGIPVTSLEAYGNAAEVQRQQYPECGISWTTLAGIAGVESKHGQYRGSDVGPTGDVRPRIRGMALDGTRGNWEIKDTDGGRLDGDVTYDRAMGPFQFIPETWARFGVDANGDGVADPDNIDDAALSAARYLCDAAGGDMTTQEGWEKAILTYNSSRPYLIRVRNHANAYAINLRY